MAVHCYDDSTINIVVAITIITIITINRQTDRETHIISRDVLIGRGLDAVSKEAENCANPEQNREAAKQLLTELDPLRDGLGRSQLVTTIATQKLGRLRLRQALQDTRQRLVKAVSDVDNANQNTQGQGRRCLWDGGTRPPIFGLGGHYHECPPQYF